VPTADVDPSVRDALELALEQCRRSLAEYQAGVVDDDELRRALFHSGLVVPDDEAWLLDLSAGQWFRYDGLALHRPTAGLGRTAVTRIRLALDDLARDLRP
jgi:hypothetical protein